MNTTGSWLGSRMNLVLSRSRVASSTASRRQNSGYSPAILLICISETLSTIVLPTDTMVALLRDVGSSSAISPTCVPAARIAISRPFITIPTEPLTIKYMSLSASPCRTITLPAKYSLSIPAETSILANADCPAQEIGPAHIAARRFLWPAEPVNLESCHALNWHCSSLMEQSKATAEPKSCSWNNRQPTKG